MDKLRPREIPVLPSDAPVFLSYSDREVEGACVGLAFFLSNGKSIVGYMKLREEVRSVWSREASAGDYYDIFEIEAVAPALIFHSWRRLFTPWDSVFAFKR